MKNTVPCFYIDHTKLLNQFKKKKKMIIENQEFISSREAADMLDYAMNYMRVLCAKNNFRKKVKAHKITGRWFFKKEDILSYGIEKGRIKN